MFFSDGIGPAVFALVGHPRIVTDAIEANLKISATFVATIVSAGHAAQFPYPAAFMAMTCSGHGIGFQAIALSSNRTMMSGECA
jgi:hypothetical protein